MNIRGASTGPLLLTRCFGREPARAELVDIVQEDRLVTLVGAPGCGKTRLGLEVGAQLTDRFSAGVCFVDLSPVVDPSLVASVVAAALEVEHSPDRSVEEVLVDVLATKDLLILLDNCEHLVSAVADLVVRLLGDCPSLHILTTSRSLLGFQGERAWPVPPLELEPAVELFRDRSVSSSPALVEEKESDEIVAQICRRLDGLPLAIELAAAWTRVLTPAEILQRLESAVPVVQSRVRDEDPRHQTIEATVDWSYRLLEPAQQLLFEQLSVFAGGFDFEAALGVVRGEDVLDGLASLIDHSLVLAEPLGSAMRYRALEPRPAATRSRDELGRGRRRERRRCRGGRRWRHCLRP